MTAIRVEMSVGDEKLDLIRSIRYAVLREPLRLTYESTLFEGDALPSARHFIAYSLDDEPIGCATVHVSVDPSNPSLGTAQLRGMAVNNSLQRSGVGSSIIEALYLFADEHGLALWCKARESAVGFYAKHGWEIEGPQFMVEGVGPHFIMRR